MPLNMLIYHDVNHIKSTQIENSIRNLHLIKRYMTKMKKALMKLRGIFVMLAHDKKNYSTANNNCSHDCSSSEINLKESIINKFSTHFFMITHSHKFMLASIHNKNLNYCDASAFKKYSFKNKVNDDVKEIVSFYFSIMRVKLESKKTTIKRIIIIKYFVIMGIYTIISLYLAIFIQSIYAQYADNVFMLCIFPIISLLVIKLTITINIILFMSTVVMYVFGNKIYNNKKINLCRIFYYCIVPIIAANHHNSILSFRQIIGNNKNKK